MTTTLHTDRVSGATLRILHVRHQSSKTRNDETAALSVASAFTIIVSTVFLAQSTSESFRGMAPPAATAPPGVSSSLDARAMERIERVHELRKEALATGTSPLPDYNDVPVRSPKRSRLENIETRARRLSSFRRPSRGRA